MSLYLLRTSHIQSSESLSYCLHLHKYIYEQIRLGKLPKKKKISIEFPKGKDHEKIQFEKMLIIAELCWMSKIQNTEILNLFSTSHYMALSFIRMGSREILSWLASLLSDQSHTALTLMEGANLFSSVTKDLCIFKDVYLLLSSTFTFSLNCLKENPKDANKKY